MCGICGELRFDGAPPDMRAIERMSKQLARRGPDHDGIFSDGPLAFGHRRLAIIDLSPSADQPMVDTALQLALVFNGTIYNYRELRAELLAMGYTFFSEGDSEVILKAYHAWGEPCVQRFSGMFAFAIWDMRAGHGGSLFLARDRFGIKPLYLAQDGQRLRFASSLPALLSGGGVDTQLDPVALHHHFTLHTVVPAPRTVLRGVRKLPPATTMTVRVDGSITQSVYWTLDATRPAQPLTEAEWLDATRKVLVRALERHRLAADVPVGVLLSGGLDSSLLVGLLADHVDDLLTFSIGFEGIPGVSVGAEKADEFEFSDLIAEQFKTRHQKHLIPNSEVLRRLPEAVAAMTEPMMSHDVIAFYLLSERVSKEVKVVLAGQGADEVFGGYFWYPLMDAETGTAVERFSRHYFDRDHAEYLDMIAPAWQVPTIAPDASDVTTELVARELSKPQADTFLDEVWRFDATTLIVDDPVKRVDNMPMAWGLEVRVPFLDHELVELAARMPPELKLKQGGKYPLKAISRGVIPDAVIDRPKGYFPVPALKHVRGPFLELMRGILLSDACVRRGLYQRAYVDKLLADPQAHFTRIQGSKLWHLALLEWWLQVHVDGVGDTVRLSPS
ncbi:MAG: N-acetylglutaminylglutamine amidotransferase [Gammaproteobacteria bacterium]|nr:N-acetylglutaminylglutamine amidotransferase [Gammaproteobacteria bacterium]MBU0786584.1 N-acetylglutaminylglutamine amidotransferase [Gammaproteobacteria bacterium]MBU0814345.1 N-acetylglutaminylglutamine amidotransferase [Gammaproteobacteria bacterium]MBU1787688.1 N-acetylglutaminylglutamine amidotransferase [Gammaproteobacteria bacterium]